MNDRLILLGSTLSTAAPGNSLIMHVSIASCGRNAHHEHRALGGPDFSWSYVVRNLPRAMNLGVSDGWGRLQSHISDEPLDFHHKGVGPLIVSEG